MGFTTSSHSNGNSSEVIASIPDDISDVVSENASVVRDAVNFLLEDIPETSENGVANSKSRSSAVKDDASNTHSLSLRQLEEIERKKKELLVKKEKKVVVAVQQAKQDEVKHDQQLQRNGLRPISLHRRRISGERGVVKKLSLEELHMRSRAKPLDEKKQREANGVSKPTLHIQVKKRNSETGFDMDETIGTPTKKTRSDSRAFDATLSPTPKQSSPPGQGLGPRARAMARNQPNEDEEEGELKPSGNNAWISGGLKKLFPSSKATERTIESASAPVANGNGDLPMSFKSVLANSSHAAGGAPGQHQAMGGVRGENVDAAKDLKVVAIKDGSKDALSKERDGDDAHAFAQCNPEMLRKYSNGSEEAKYLISHMDSKLRACYCRMIDAKAISEYDIDNRCLQKLCTMTPVSDTLAMLDVLRDQLKGGHIRNVSAYLERMINRETNKRNAMQVNGVVNGKEKPEKIKVDIAPQVERSLQRLYSLVPNLRQLMSSELYMHLGAVPPTVAMSVLMTLEGVDIHKIRNFKAFFISLINKYMREIRETAGIADHNTYHHHAHHSHNGFGKSISPASAATSWRKTGPDHRDWGEALPSRSSQVVVRDHTKMQLAIGVRIDEFHSLSDFARTVPGAIALQLQNLHDAGVDFVTLLDDVCWRVLSTLEETLAASIVMDVGHRLRQEPKIRNVNAFFLAMVKKKSDMLFDEQHNHAQSHHHHHHHHYDHHHSGDSNGLSHQNGRYTSPNGCRSFTANTLGSPEGFLDPGRFDLLSKGTRRELDLLISSSCGLLDHNMFDKHHISVLKQLGDRDMKTVCEQLRKVDPRKIRNIANFFIGMCRQMLIGNLRT